MDDNPGTPIEAVTPPRRKRRFKREDHHGIAGGNGAMREALCECGRTVLALVDGLCGKCSVRAEYRRRAADGKLTRADLSERAYGRLKREGVLRESLR